ncbi:hypothetical protein AAFN88_11940 [Pelagibius sp. CAU 1746]|uniref:hypothetical protein n=1 Tax=Pelagibius sp. CAU 1746 TaxID=3140370 RepID=UPI00325ACE5C
MKVMAISMVLTAAGLLASCTPQGDLNPSFGDSVRHNMSVHIINPTPEYGASQQIGPLDGPRAAGAQTRYDKGEVIQPERLRTSDTESK